MGLTSSSLRKILSEDFRDWEEPLSEGWVGQGRLQTSNLKPQPHTQTPSILDGARLHLPAGTALRVGFLPRAHLVALSGAGAAAPLFIRMAKDRSRCAHSTTLRLPPPQTVSILNPPAL